MEKQFMVVSNNRIYLCAGIDEVISKTSALSAFNISYQIYYKIGGEWVDMKVAPQHFMSYAR